MKSDLLTKKDVCIIIHNQLLQELVAAEVNIKQLLKQEMLGLTGSTEQMNAFKQKKKHLQEALTILGDMIKSKSESEEQELN